MGIILRTLEHQVLKQMRHTRLTVVFLARSHKVGHVDRSRRFAGIRIKHNLEAIGQTVLRDALHRHIGRRQFVHIFILLAGHSGASADRSRRNSSSKQDVIDPMH